MRVEYWHALLGGALIGIGAACLLLLNGRIAGISGILENAIRGLPGPRYWRIAFLLGLVLPAAISGIGAIYFTGDYAILALSGILVGFGTRLGSGCTSGHGVCGIANVSKRSLVATLTFILAGMLTVFIVRHVIAA